MAEGVRAAALAGLVVRCRSALDECLDGFRASVAYPLEAAEADLEFELACDAAGFVVRQAGEVLARTRHCSNLVSLLQPVVEQRSERFYPRWLRVHAGAVWHQRWGTVLLVGTAGVGKSTAALSFCRAGWGYLGDDLALLDPAERTVQGLGWAIRLKCDPEGLAALGDEGFGVSQETWHDDAVGRFCCALLCPPCEQLGDALRARRLGAIVCLSRGKARLGELSAGEMLLRLWPNRVARSDGAEPWPMAALADALAPVPAAELVTNRPGQVVPMLTDWLAARAADPEP